MKTVEIRDDVIWLKHVNDDEIRRQLSELPASRRLRLKVAGRVGVWEKMKDGSDGRPTQGFKPVGETHAYWARLQQLRGAKVDFEVLGTEDDDKGSAELRALTGLLQEWSSAADEAAFRDL